MALKGGFVYDSYGYPTSYNEEAVITTYGTCLRVMGMNYNEDEDYIEINGLLYDPTVYSMGVVLNPAPTVLAGMDILFVPTYYDSIDGTDVGSICASIYNTGTEEWTWLGETTAFYPSYLEASCARLANTYAAYFSVISNLDMSVYSSSVFVFENKIATECRLFEWVDGTTTFWGNVARNAMDITDSGVIACLTLLEYYEESRYDQWAISIGFNKGSYWREPYIFEATLSNYGHWGCANVRFDASNNLWVAIQGCDSSTGYFYIYKLSNLGVDWTLIHTESFSYQPYYFTYSIDPTGQYQYINMVGVLPETRLLYVSDDYGVTFTGVNKGASEDSPVHTSNDPYVLIPSITNLNFRYSSNRGTLFSAIEPPTGQTISGTYADIQNDGSHVAYVDNAIWFTEGSYDYLGFIYSDDNGATWEAIQSPFSGYGTTPTNIVDIDDVNHMYTHFWNIPSIDVKLREDVEEVLPDYYVYVSTYNDPSYIFKINPITMEIINKISFAVNAGCFNDGEYNPITRYAYYAGGWPNESLFELDIDTFTITQTIPISELYHSSYPAIAIDTTRNEVYITSGYGATDYLVKVDPITATYSTITLPNASTNLNTEAHYDSTTDCVYVGAGTGNYTLTKYIYKIDCATFTLVDTLSFVYGGGGSYINGFTYFQSFIFNGNYLYASASYYLYKIDLTTFTVTTSAYATDSKRQMVIVGSYLYIACVDDPAYVLKYDLDLNLIDTLLVEAGTDDETYAAKITVDPTNTYLFVGLHSGNGSVWKIDIETFTQVGEVIPLSYADAQWAWTIFTASVT